MDALNRMCWTVSEVLFSLLPAPLSLYLAAMLPSHSAAISVVPSLSSLSLLSPPATISGSVLQVESSIRFSLRSLAASPPSSTRCPCQPTHGLRVTSTPLWHRPALSKMNFGN